MFRPLAFSFCLSCLPAPALAQTDFLPGECVWSVASEWALPEDRPAGDANELALQLDLESLGPDSEGFELWRHRPSQMLFVFVPGGTFTMGSSYSDLLDVQGPMRDEVIAIEQPQNEVYVSPFFIGLYEVTNAQYQVFLDAVERGEVRPHEYPLAFEIQLHSALLNDRPEMGFQEDSQPIAGIGWGSAWAMSRWMGGRLPTEAEWEKACRGTDGRRYPWGNRPDPRRANVGPSRNMRTTPVGLYPGGRSPYGCYDMIGNVCEYCLDAFEKKLYQKMPLKDPCLLKRNDREERACVSRGGAFSEHHGQAVYTRATARCREYSHRWFSTGMEEGALLWSGFRVVLSPQADLYPPGWLDQRRIEVQDQKNTSTDEAPTTEDDGGGLEPLHPTADRPEAGR